MHIALLWGINISGKNKVPMANLKKSFEALGWSHRHAPLADIAGGQIMSKRTRQYIAILAALAA